MTAPRVGAARSSGPLVVTLNADPLEVSSVPKVMAEVQLDAGVLARVDAVAAASGSSRGQVIEDSLRRSLAGAALSEALSQIRERGRGLAEAEASELAYAEVKAARVARRESGDGVSAKQHR